MHRFKFYEKIHPVSSNLFRLRILERCLKINRDFSRFVVDVLPGYSIPMFIHIREDLETAGPYKIKKYDLRKEAYDLSVVKNPIHF